METLKSSYNAASALSALNSTLLSFSEASGIDSVIYVAWPGPPYLLISLSERLETLQDFKSIQKGTHSFNIPSLFLRGRAGAKRRTHVSILGYLSAVLNHFAQCGSDSIRRLGSAGVVPVMVRAGNVTMAHKFTTQLRLLHACHS